MTSASATTYRGRLAPSPTGYLHLGHARTFWTAYQRALDAGGGVILRNEDLDGPRCKPEFFEAMLADLKWLGFEWIEGPDCGGPHEPYSQSLRADIYHDAFLKLRDTGFLYPCICSRQDVLRALEAPHAADDEPVYPGTCLKNPPCDLENHRVNWRFRVPCGKKVEFDDLSFGKQSFLSGVDFGDFVAWRHDGISSYQLAVVVDDSSMEITEVVRGADLLVSTARQLLIYEALNLTPPAFFHCPLVTDEKGVRLAKRHDALSLRSLRTGGETPEDIRSRMGMLP